MDTGSLVLCNEAIYRQDMLTLSESGFRTFGHTAMPMSPNRDAMYVSGVQSSSHPRICSAKNCSSALVC